MQAMVLDQFGGPEVLHMAEIERPEATPGQVVIQVAYASVNPADWKAREGWLAQYFQYQFPFVVGFDAAGVVAAVGEGVTGLAVGDRVVTPGNQGMGERGSYAEYVRSAAERVIPLPAKVTFLQAATLPTAGMTAWKAVFDNGQVGPGQKVVVNGGAGGTGGFAIQLARMAGAEVATTCSAGNFEYVRQLGASHAIDYRAGSVVKAIRAWAPGGVDLIIDTVGQGTFVDTIETVRRGGVICPIGTLIADEAPYDPARLTAAGVSVIPTISDFESQPRQLAGLVEALSSGRIRVPDHVIMPLAEAGRAHALVQAGHVRGKILLEVNSALEN